MRHVLPAPLAELLDLHAVRMRPPVFRGRVVPPLALGAGERDDVAHDLLRDLRHHARPHRPPPPPNPTPQPLLNRHRLDQPHRHPHYFPPPTHLPPHLHPPHRPPPLPNRKPQLLVHRHRLDQLDRHRHVVPRHHHLHPARQRAHPRHVRRPKIKLRPVPVEKRRVPPPFVLPQHVHLRLELLVRLDRPRLRQHLPPLHFVFIDPAQQRADVISGSSFVQHPPTHLHPLHHRLLRLRLHPHDLDLFPHLHDPPLHPPRHHGAAPRDREYVLDRHQKRLVHRPRRCRNVAVHRLHQVPDALRRRRVLRLLHRPQGTAPHHRDVVPRKLVLLQQLPHLQLHQVQNLRVVHHVHLVHEHHQARHVHLPRQQHVLPRLRQRPVVGRHYQNRPVHLRRPRDHVLDVVRVPRTVDVRVVPLRRLVLHVAHRDRDPPLPLLRGVVDRPKVPHRHPAVLRVQHLRDRTRQRRLPVIDVPDRPDVHVRLRPVELCLGHASLP